MKVRSIRLVIQRIRLRQSRQRRRRSYDSLLRAPEFFTHSLLRPIRRAGAE